MQIKKDEVNASLLLAAQKEFLIKGFDRASIRGIVKSANTTIGNFYNYFESKESIFSELVDSSYKDLIDFINNHEDAEMDRENLHNMDTHAIRQATDGILGELVPKFNDSFLLLINYTGNTKYVNAKNEIIDFIAEHFMEHINEYAPQYAYPQMGRIVSSQLVHGIAEIIKENKDEEIRHKLITEQILFTSLGVMGILMGGPHDTDK